MDQPQQPDDLNGQKKQNTDNNKSKGWKLRNELYNIREDKTALQKSKYFFRPDLSKRHDRKVEAIKQCEMAIRTLSEKDIEGNYNIYKIQFGKRLEDNMGIDEMESICQSLESYIGNLNSALSEIETARATLNKLGLKTPKSREILNDIVGFYNKHSTLRENLKTLRGDVAKTSTTLAEYYEVENSLPEIQSMFEDVCSVYGDKGQQLSDFLKMQQILAETKPILEKLAQADKKLQEVGYYVSHKYVQLCNDINDLDRIIDQRIQVERQKLLEQAKSFKTRFDSQLNLDALSFQSQSQEVLRIIDRNMLEGVFAQITVDAQKILNDLCKSLNPQYNNELVKMQSSIKEIEGIRSVLGDHSLDTLMTKMVDQYNNHIRRREGLCMEMLMESTLYYADHASQRLNKIESSYSDLNAKFAEAKEQLSIDELEKMHKNLNNEIIFLQSEKPYCVDIVENNLKDFDKLIGNKRENIKWIQKMIEIQKIIKKTTPIFEQLEYGIKELGILIESKIEENKKNMEEIQKAAIVAFNKAKEQLEKINMNEIGKHMITIQSMRNAIRSMYNAGLMGSIENPIHHPMLQYMKQEYEKYDKTEVKEKIAEEEFKKYTQVLREFNNSDNLSKFINERENLKLDKNILNNRLKKAKELMADINKINEILIDQALNELMVFCKNSSNSSLNQIEVDLSEQMEIAREIRQNKKNILENKIKSVENILRKKEEEKASKVFNLLWNIIEDFNRVQRTFDIFIQKDIADSSRYDLGIKLRVCKTRINEIKLIESDLHQKDIIYALNVAGLSQNQRLNERGVVLKNGRELTLIAIANLETQLEQRLRIIQEEMENPNRREWTKPIALSPDLVADQDPVPFYTSKNFTDHIVIEEAPNEQKVGNELEIKNSIEGLERQLRVTRSHTIKSSDAID